MTSPYGEVGLDAVEIFATGLAGAEGVVFDVEGNLYGGGGDGIVRRVSADGAVSAFATTGGRPAGMAFDREGNLFVCEIGLSAMVKVDGNGNVGTFAERAGDHVLKVPNFPVFDADGNLYVTDTYDRPIREIRGSERPRHVGALLRFRPDGSGEVIASGIDSANGCAIDPDEEAVYVLRTMSQDCIRVPFGGGDYDVFCEVGANVDGMAFDAEGYAIITLPQANGLVVADSGGNVSTIVSDPEGCKLELATNCAFGGPGFDELYTGSLTADHICRIRVGRRGHPLYHQR